MKTADIINHITQIYANNAFMHYCGIEIAEIFCGEASVSLNLRSDIHTNINNKLHGGLLMTLMDNATGIAAASIGKRVVTMSMTVNFIKGAQPGDKVIAHAQIVNCLDEIINMKIDVYKAATQELLATGISSMLSIADFEEIPAHW